jgi:hypothetical protein
MSIPNASSLYQRINKGAEGGLEFARIINQLLISESSIGEIRFTSYSDAAGDYKGVDAVINTSLNKSGLQYKFVPSSFSSNHKSEIKTAFHKAIKNFPDMDEWILVTPEDINKFDLTWLETISNEFKIPIVHWGHSKIINLMLKHKHIGEQYYSDLNYAISKPSTEPSSEDIKYFDKFMNPDIDITLLLLKAQPTLADCKMIFAPVFYKEAADVYYLQYRTLLDNSDGIHPIKSKQFAEVRANTYAEIISKSHFFPGGMHMMQEKYSALNSNTKFYRVDFKEIGAEYGISFAVWCFLNGRWVFFPKPFRVIETIVGMRNDKNLNRMIKILKWAGINKQLKNEYKNKSLLAVNHIMHKLLSDDKTK